MKISRLAILVLVIALALVVALPKSDRSHVVL